MKLKDAIQKLGERKSTELARKIADEMGVVWVGGLCFIFKVIVDNLDRVPGNIGGENDDEESAIRKWVQKYKTGCDACASKRTSNPPGTIADPIIEQIIGARLINLTDLDLNRVIYAHRLGMSAENVLGLMLEEYLAINLREHGWHCAWGETVRSVDFVNEDGSLLQIKNRSNSENSSSSAIRSGTTIKKWYRVKAGRIEYMWSALNQICGTSHLSEDGFVEFVKSTLSSNPECLAVESNNPWQ